MSPALRALLTATGVTVAGFGVYFVAPGANPDEVRATALADGFVARAAEAEFSLTPAGRAWLADAGITAPAYARLQFPVGLGLGKESHVCTGFRLNDGGSTGEVNPDGGSECSDGGNVVILPDLPFQLLRRVRFEDLDVATCASRPNVCPLWGTARPFRVTAHSCAWKPSAGAVCTKSDGGNPGVENTMQPGTWVGAGCRPKSCVEIAGESSAP